MSNALSISRQYFAKMVSLQLTPKHVETQSWVTKTVRWRSHALFQNNVLCAMWNIVEFWIQWTHSYVILTLLVKFQGL